MIPWSTFVDPEVAQGSYRRAGSQGTRHSPRGHRVRIDDLDRAIADGEAHGFVKVLTVPGKDRILEARPSSANMPAICWPVCAGDASRHRLNWILGTIPSTRP
ncbi:MAG: hypothetical protein R3F40_18530 [Candidatus Competibacteraceae bacterium]